MTLGAGLGRLFVLVRVDNVKQLTLPRTGRDDDTTVRLGDGGDDEPVPTLVELGLTQVADGALVGAFRPRSGGDVDGFAGGCAVLGNQLDPQLQKPLRGRECGVDGESGRDILCTGRAGDEVRLACETLQGGVLLEVLCVVADDGQADGVHVDLERNLSLAGRWPLVEGEPAVVPVGDDPSGPDVSVLEPDLPCEPSKTGGEGRVGQP